MSTLGGNWEPLTGQSSWTRCSCTLQWGCKEAERLICQGHRGSTSEPDLEAGCSAMELVAYQTSHKEICDIYHSVYLLRRPLDLPPCEDQWRRRAICNILSSLTSWLHWCGHPATTGEGQESKEEWLPRPDRRESYEEVLRAAHQRALETTEVLRGDIERLSWGIRNAPQTCSGSCSRSHTRSHTRSQSRSHGRACSQSNPQSGCQSIQPRSPTRPQSGRRVTFRELEVEQDPKGGVENCPLEPPILDVETWLDWQDCQLSTPTWWLELQAILGVKDPQKLACKIWASFSIPEVRMKAILGQITLCPPPPNA